jgi:putative endonuclease
MHESPSETGRAGEALAATYLEERGFRVMDRNYRFERSEVDIVCFLPAPRYEDGGELVFVEVKTRRGTGFGLPEEAVGADKQRHLVKAARAWLHERRMEGTPCRFDVVSILLRNGAEPEIHHIENAFWIF